MDQPLSISADPPNSLLTFRMEKHDNIKSDLECKAVLAKLFPDIRGEPTVRDDTDDPTRYYVITYPDVPNNHPFREELRTHRQGMDYPPSSDGKQMIPDPITRENGGISYKFLSIQGVTYGGKYKRKNRKSRKGRKSRKSKRRSKRSV